MIGSLERHNVIQSYPLSAPPHRPCGLLTEDYTKPAFRISAEKVFASVIKAGLPTSFDNRLSDFPIRDQGDQASCVAFAANNVAEVLEYRDTTHLRTRLSPQYTYNARSNASEGMFFSDLGNILTNTYGVVPEVRYPYGKTKGNKSTIPAELVALGQQHKMKDFAQIWTMDSLKAAIYNNGGAVVAFKVYNYSTHFWKPSDSNDNWDDNHAVAIVAYDDLRRVFTLENSWGKDWGNNGYADYTYEEFDKHLHDAIFTFADVTGSPEITDPPVPEKKGCCNGCTLM